MKHNQVRQVLFPILAALIWGTAFVAQDLCADAIDTFTFNAIRSYIAVVALLVLIVIFDAVNKNKPSLTAIKRKAANCQMWFGGICCGTAGAGVRPVLHHSHSGDRPLYRHCGRPEA